MRIAANTIHGSLDIDGQYSGYDMACSKVNLPKGLAYLR